MAKQEAKNAPEEKTSEQLLQEKIDRKSVV